ncbi:MAG: hypothetical protein KGJ82_11205 [Nitrospirota bacterium]|nr:hypothetical protein [Nitrospirota bacterium]
MNIGDLTVTIGADSTDLSGKLQMASDEVMKFGALAGVAGGVASKAFEMVAEAAKGMAEALPEAAQHAAEMAHELDQVSQRTGLSTNYIQALTPALNQVGLSSMDLAQGFRRLAADIQAAQNPSSHQAEMFNRLGISARGLSDPGEAFSLISARLAEMPDGFEKTSLATELLSRTGINLIPILNQGADGFAESGRKAQEYGLMLNSSALTALEHLEKSYKDNQLAADSWSTHIGLAIAPVIQQFNELSTAGKVNSIPLIDQWGVSIAGKMALLKDFFGFLKEQAQLSVTDISGLVDVFNKWNEQSIKDIAAAKGQAQANIAQADSTAANIEKAKAHQAALQALDAAQEALGETMRNIGVEANQLDASEYGTKNIQAAIELSGRFRETITPTDMEAEMEKGNQIVEGSMRDRAIAITEYGKAAVEAADRVNAVFGAGTTDPSQGNNQEQLGAQALQAYQQAKATNAMRLQDEATTDNAVQALQQQMYANESMFLGAADAARRVANTALTSQQAIQMQDLKNQLDAGTIDYQAYEARVNALEIEGTAKRMQIISQYPTFVEKQLSDLVSANTFSMSQISNTFTQNVSKMIVEGGKLTKMWTQIEETMVQAFLNAGIQMLAQASLNFLKETALFETMETAKTALANAMGVERVAAQKAEQEAGVANAEAALAQMGALAEASGAIAEAVVLEIAAVFAAMGAALAASAVGAPFAPAFEDAALAVGEGGSAAVAISQAGIDTAIGTAQGVIAATGVPALAGGGIVTGPTFALVGEAGPEAVIPLSQLGSVGGSGGGSGDFTFQLYLDGDTIANMVVRKMPHLVRFKTGLR